MAGSRRRFIRSLSRSALVLPFADLVSLAQKLPGPVERSYDAKAKTGAARSKIAHRRNPARSEFVDVVKEAGLAVKTIYGGEGKNKYLLETTGCGLAFYDYDRDGWLDVFLVNGWRLEGFPDGKEPRCHLFKNNRDGTFTDVTKGSGLEHRTGWGQACCVGDYNNDGYDDFSSPTTARTRSIAITGTVLSLMSPKKPASRSPAPKSTGTPAALLWITIATATSISSSRTMSIST